MEDSFSNTESEQQSYRMQKYDIVGSLPSEMTERVLSSLSPEDLMSCCAVSKTWRNKISSLQNFWKKQAKSLGYNVTTASVDVEEETDWCEEFQFTMRIRNEMKAGTAWQVTNEIDLEKKLGREEIEVTFVGLDKDYIAVLAEDAVTSHCSNSQLTIWSLKDNRLMSSIDLTPATIKFRIFRYPYVLISGRMFVYLYTLDLSRNQS